MAFLDRESLKDIGFAELGANVLISDRVSVYGAQRIKIGNNVRIDDFCVLSAGVGGIEIGDFVHIAVYASLIGAGKIGIADFCNISSRVSIYTSNDDYSGETLTNPMIPDQFKKVRVGDVLLSKHVIVGSGSVILPNVLIGEGVAIGALSLVSKNCDPFYVYAGKPAKKIKERKRDLLVMENVFRQNMP